MPNYEIKFRFTDTTLIDADSKVQAEYITNQDFTKDLYPDFEIISIEEVVD